jgi:hypothetical protein
MGKIKLCEECGVPLLLTRGYVWHDNGVITPANDPDNRMVFAESETIDALFRGIEDIIGLSIEKIVVESKRREVNQYVEKMLSPLERKAARRLGTGKVIERLSMNGRAFGYGDISLAGRRRTGDSDDFITMSVMNSHSLLLICGEVLGAWEAIDGRDHYLEYEKVSDDTYHVTCHVGEHPIELKERLQFESFPVKQGDLLFERCSTCGVPLEITQCDWNLDDGTIIHSETGRRMSLFGPRGIEAILRDLEAELGDTIPSVVVDALRLYMKELMQVMSWLGDLESYRRMIAYRGLGIVSRYEPDGISARVTLENPCMVLLLVGLMQALFELNRRVDSSKCEYERSPDGDHGHSDQALGCRAARDYLAAVQPVVETPVDVLVMPDQPDECRQPRYPEALRRLLRRSRRPTDLDLRDGKPFTILPLEACQHPAGSVHDLGFSEKVRAVRQARQQRHARAESARVGGVDHGSPQQSGHPSGSVDHYLEVAPAGAGLARDGDDTVRNGPPARAPHQQSHAPLHPVHGARPYQLPADRRPDAPQRGVENAVVRTPQVPAVLPHGGLVFVVGLVASVGVDQHERVVVVPAPGADERAAHVGAVAARRLDHQLKSGPLERLRHVAHIWVKSDGGREEFGKDDHLAVLS